MKEKNRRIEELLVLGTVVLLLLLTLMVFNKAIPTSFQEITGNVVTTVNVTLPISANCTFTLYPGLNLVSFFCISTLTPVSEVVGGISSNLEAVFEYQEGGTDAWKIYNPSLPSFVIQDLHYMSRTKGYWLRMRNTQNYSLVGNLRIPNSINIIPGWNLLGYPVNRTKLVNESFISIEGNFTEVRAYNSLTGSFISYVPGVGGALNQTEPYKGYWINATVVEVWVVD
jgi:hypothetical protein